jgi:hypothetical protein
MENEGTIVIPIIGYVISLIIPIVGLIYGAALFYLKKDVLLYRKHGRYIIYFSIAMFIISTIIKILF